MTSPQYKDALEKWKKRREAIIKMAAEHDEAGNAKFTLEQVGARYGVTKQRVWAIMRESKK